LKIKADLHIHSCLSPCGSLEMSPSVIVEKAENAGLNVIALTDHNNTENLPAFGKICNRKNITPLFGLEVNTAEEIHVLCLFGNLDTAMDFGRFIYNSLPDIANNPDIMGDQPVVDENGYITGYIRKTLFGASSYGIIELLNMTHENGGLFVPSHIDRPSNSLLASLGYLPDYNFDAVEISAFSGISAVPFPAGKFFTVENSDAHYPEDIGKRFNKWDLQKPDFENIEKLFNSRNNFQE